MDRRNFLRRLGLCTTGFVLDPELLTWRKGARTFFLPTPEPIWLGTWGRSIPDGLGNYTSELIWRRVTAYDRATRTATIDAQWVTPPDASSVYRILPGLGGAVVLGVPPVPNRIITPQFA